MVRPNRPHIHQRHSYPSTSRPNFRTDSRESQKHYGIRSWLMSSTPMGISGCHQGLYITWLSPSLSSTMKAEGHWRESRSYQATLWYCISKAFIASTRIRGHRISWRRWSAGMEQGIERQGTKSYSTGQWISTLNCPRNTYCPIIFYPSFFISVYPSFPGLRNE